MARTTQQWARRITTALRKAGMYNTSLSMQIQSLASAMHTLELSTEEIDNLKSTTVMERTRYGEKLAPHPAFKVQRDAQISITRQMKQLRLTTEQLSTDQSSDPLVDLTQRLLGV